MTFPVPSASVIMPLYNGERFLDAAVESVLAQRVTDWELFIIDDGSKDGSLERARAWAARDRRIRALQHPGGANRGVSETRNVGLREARAPWIALLDCDDAWLPDKLERQLDVIARHPDISLVYSRAQVIDDQGRHVTVRRPGMNRPPIFGSGRPDTAVRDFVGYLRGRYWYPTCSVMFRRDAAAACGNFEPLPYQVEDTLLFCRLSERGAVWFIDEVLALYRIHGNQWNSGLSASRHAEGRFTYLSILARTLEGESRRVSAEALVDVGLGTLGRQLVGGREFRPLRFLAFAGRVIGARHLPLDLRLRALALTLGRIALSPLQAALRLRNAMRGRHGAAADPRPVTNVTGPDGLT